MARILVSALTLILVGLPLGCGGEKTAPAGLMLAFSKFKVSPEGKVLYEPGPALLQFLVQKGDAWEVSTLEDSESNVFHKAMVYTPPGQAAGLLTLGGTVAAVKLRRPGAPAETLWTKTFGDGKHSRMRDAEIGDLFGDGRDALAIATHNQGVVATVRPKQAGGFEVTELDTQEGIWVHEIEIGDLDGDGTLEVYATPSLPNKLDGTPQPGKVVRYVPATGEGRVVVADLGMRHAKEILVDDVDGDGTDELYVVVETETKGNRLVRPVEILRFDADTDPTGGVVIARLAGESMCRFLTAGDVDGDGKKELVAAAKSTGLWLLRPGPDPRAMWTSTTIDRQSGGFEHAALLTDLDADGKDELYVSSDKHGEVRRYTWNGRSFDREVLHKREHPGAYFCWNIMPVPTELIP